jgi:hypothetical protein
MILMEFAQVRMWLISDVARERGCPGSARKGRPERTWLNHVWS